MAGKGRRFEKGNQMSKGKGRKPMPEELKGVRKLSAEHVERVLYKFANMTRATLDKLLVSDTATMLELMIGNVLKHAADSGDHSRLNFFLDRTIGKTPNPIEITRKPYKATEITPDNVEDIYAKAHEAANRLRVVGE